jgi:hypothetical protein
MQEEIDILKWWESLNENWKYIFEGQIQINSTFLKISLAFKKDLSVDEKRLTNIEEDFERNTPEMKYLALKNLFQTDKIVVGKNSKFKLENLEPLKQLTNLKNIRFNNCNIYDLKALEELKTLEKLEFHNVKIYTNSSSVFNNIKNVQICFEKSIIQS